jgi:hypothetical protein
MTWLGSAYWICHECQIHKIYVIDAAQPKGEK